MKVEKGNYVAENVGDLTFCMALTVERWKEGVVRVHMVQRDVTGTRHANHIVYASDELAIKAGLKMPDNLR